MTPITLTFHQDPGHGWIEANWIFVCSLGLRDKVSSYSYVNDGRVFLEEDVDAPMYLKALKENGYIYKINSKLTHYDSPIRGYRRLNNSND